MLYVVIKGPSYQEIEKQMTLAASHGLGVELRVDLFSEWDLPFLKKLRKAFSTPWILTLRSEAQGGGYKGSQRLSDLELLATLEPEHLDVEYDVPCEWIKKIRSNHPAVKIILSYHDFQGDSPIEEIYHKMREKPASYYKIAIASDSTLKTLQFLVWARSQGGVIIPICMGPYGQISRILGPVIGSPITYAALDDNSSELGQLSAQRLLESYRFSQLHPQTALYGLIGFPLESSISDLRHNYVFSECGKDALYVKIPMKPLELKGCLPLLQQLSFKGLSVTMPLKEEVIPLLADIDPEAKKMGAVNTLLLTEKGYVGFNTDGIGAIKAIEKETSLQGKKIVVLGAGGASRAIIHVALLHGALVTIVNRSEEKGRALAEELNCDFKPLKESLPSYDILIHCTPAEMPIKAEELLPGSIVMDIKNGDSLLLEEALKRGCKIIHGKQMFIFQAIEQYALWFQESLPEMARALEYICHASVLSC